MPNLTLYEQETIINWNRAEDTASIYTHDKGLMATLERRGFNAVRKYVFDGRIVAKAYTVPKNWIAVRPPRTASAAQKAALAKARAAQNADPAELGDFASKPSARVDGSRRRTTPATSNPSTTRRATQ